MASSKSTSSAARITSHAVVQAQTSRCAYCQDNHYIAACLKFQNLSNDNCHKFVLEKHLCFNCLGPHPLRDCRSKKSCKVCHGRHHSLLHASLTTELKSLQPSAENVDLQAKGVTSHNINAFSPCTIMLATARLIASSALQRQLEVRALVDPCSAASFITESLAQRLKLPRQVAFVPVSGVGGTPCQTVKSQAIVNISPHFDVSQNWKIKALILPRLTDYLPSSYALKSDLSLIDNVCLADPRFDSMDVIDMIIGADFFPQIIQVGLKKSKDQTIIAQATALGWIITGSVPSQSSEISTSDQPITNLQCIIDQDLSELLEKFWQQDEISPKTPQTFTQEKIDCEEHFASTHRRTSEGRYVLRLPFKSNLSELGDSSAPARSMLIRMENRFDAAAPLQEQYVRFMEEYIELNHMTEATGDSTIAGGFYLPHHGVLKGNGETSKVRVVFNGSVKLNNGLSLNDCLHVGPRLQTDIYDILLRWRMFQYAFSTDIEKMFRQILIDPDDQKFQMIYWRTAKNQPIRTFYLRTVTYGLASSPYAAIKTLRQLAKDEALRFPAASRLLLENIYVDDILAGADTLSETRDLQQELISLLKRGGFPLSKWAATSPELLADIPVEHIAPPLYRTWQHSEEFQMLGISWQSTTDSFIFRFKNGLENDAITKRKALSFIGRLFDPIGWITPISINFKIFMQSL